MSDYSSSSTVAWSLKDAVGNTAWTATASGTSTGVSQAESEAALNQVMYRQLLTLLSNGLKRIFSSDILYGVYGADSNLPTTYPDCVTSSKTYTYDGGYALWGENPESSTQSRLIGYVDMYTVREKSCSGPQQVEVPFGIKVYSFTPGVVVAPDVAVTPAVVVNPINTVTTAPAVIGTSAVAGM